MILVDTRTLVPVSVTGDYCPMQCKHCGGVYLRHMVHVNEMESYARKGYRVFLVSGGMMPDGRIPFEPYYEKLKYLKEEYGLKYNFHIGFPQTFPTIVEELADVISADFFADASVMEEVYGISRTPQQILDILGRFEKPVVPHVTIGILCGKITHEFRALEILSKEYPWVVLNVFIPTLGTVYKDCFPPSVEEVEEIFRGARELFRTVFLGCMQPKGKYRVELQQRLHFIDGITKPVIEGERVMGCCAFYVISN